MKTSLTFHHACIHLPSQHGYLHCAHAIGTEREPLERFGNRAGEHLEFVRCALSALEAVESVDYTHAVWLSDKLGKDLSMQRENSGYQEEDHDYVALLRGHSGSP